MKYEIKIKMNYFPAYFFYLLNNFKVSFTLKRPLCWELRKIKAFLSVENNTYLLINVINTYLLPVINICRIIAIEIGAMHMSMHQ